MRAQVRTRFFDAPRPRVLAHRGLATETTENTLASFEAAIAAGATHIESDVQVSRDGVAILAHDPDVSRLTGRSERVADLTAAELEQLDLGDGHGFARLSTALRRFPGAFFNLDVKDARAAAPLAAAVTAAGATDRVLITSFSERRRASATSLLPGVASSASSPRVALAILGSYLDAAPLVALALAPVDALQIPTGWRGISFSTGTIIRRLQRSGREVHFWTVNDAATMTALLRAGADGLVTDRCDLAVEVVTQRP